MFSAAKSGAASSEYNLTNSLRFRASASAYLSRTFTTPTSSTIWTWSAWVKRGALTGTYRLFGASTTTYLTFNSSDQLNLTLNGVSAATSTAVFRDPSAWYHIVYTQNGASQTIYVNNVSVATGTTAASIFNTAIAHQIGSANTSNYLDGYLTEINFVDGQALSASSFGSTNATTGVWQPAPYSGTYGTNGFYLKFADASAATAAAIGKDSSGNGNNWTPSGISVTAGTTYDAMIDSPTLTSTTVSNYCVLNTLDKGSGTVSNGNITWTHTANLERNIRGTMAIPSGKFYWEAIPSGSAAQGIGIANSTAPLVGVSGSTFIQYQETGQKSINNVRTAYGATYTSGDVIGVAFDSTANSLVFYKNNVSQGAISVTSGLTYFAWIGGYNSTVNINFGQKPFTYTPPTGYVALNTYNLPDSAIKKGNNYMDATTYTGTGASQSITNAAGFKPDFVWIKGRSGATDNALYDFVRGTTKDLVSNSTAAETTQAQGLTAFNSNGFTVGTLAKLNTNAATYVGWQWDGSGATVSNTSGTITSTVDANTTAGFSIITYTGNGINLSTVGHGLGVTPKIWIIKNRGATSQWRVFYTVFDGTLDYMFLEATTAKADSTITLPTSSVFYVGTGADNNVSGNTYVTYAFTDIEGYSKFGSYTGNGSTDGTFVYTGFRPKFVMIKNATTGGAGYNWNIFDSTRNTYNVVSLSLTSNTATAEFTEADLDFTANGFKLRVTNVGLNTSGSTYIYMAFAENPFKNALAR